MSMLRAVEKFPLNSDWMTLVFLFILILLALVKVLYADRFRSLMTCFFSKNYFLDYTQDRSESIGLFQVVLFLVQNMILGLFLYLLTMEFGSRMQENSFQSYVKYVIFTTVFLGIQYGMAKAVSLFFGFQKRFEVGNYAKSSLLMAGTIFYLPVLLCWIYAYPHSQTMLYISLLFAGGFWLFRWGFLLIFNIQVIKKNLFYFILYICSLEIVPILLFVKRMV